ncbi:MAG: hypothetical protein SGILL_005685 [Bacillariaceae sp.]
MKLFTSAALLLSACIIRQADASIDCSLISKQATEDFAPDPCQHFGGGDHESYIDWLSKTDNAYPNSAFLLGSDPDEEQSGAAVHWNIDDEYLYIAVAARASGWVGFGISEAGGMLGTDMVLFEAANPDVLIDAYTNDDRFPQTDDCASDWEMIESHVDLDGFIVFEAKRKLDTQDPQDKPILDDSSSLVAPHRVIAAWGDSQQVGYHGLDVARGAIRFYGGADEEVVFNAAMDRNAEGSALMIANQFTIPAVDTIYQPFCFSRQHLIDEGVPDTTDKLNIVGWSPQVEKGNEAFVHHYVVTASTNPNACNGTEDDVDQDFIEMVYVWAPGEKGIAFPDFLGAPLFGDDGFQAFEMEIHYNNPTLVEGVVDNSGVRLYWTSEEKEQEIGIMNIGDPLIGVYGEPVGQGLSVHQFECPSSCSALAGQEVTVLREYLHMHEVGLRMTNEQIRDGEVLRSANVEFWEFAQNGNAVVQQDSFTVMPGDSFRTSCYYEDQQGDRTFGLASAEEMCMAFLYYHPRVSLNLGEFSTSWFCGYGIPIPQCEATYEKRVIESKEELNRQYAVKNSACAIVDSVSEEDDSGSASSTYLAGAGVVGALGALLL